MSPSSRRASDLQIVGGTLDDRPKIVGGQRQPGRTREVQEVRHDLAERLGLLPDAFDVRLELRRKRSRVEQLAVTVNSGEAVAEFVGDPRRQFAESRQGFLQSELFLELHDRRQVREQADDATSTVRAKRGDGHADVGHVARVRHLQGTAHDRSSRCQALVDYRGQRSRRHGQPGVMGPLLRGIDAEHPPAGRVEDLDLTGSIDHEQSGGNAVDDLRVQALRRFGALGQCALLRAQLLDGLLQGSRQQRRFAASRLRARSCGRPTESAARRTRRWPREQRPSP